MFFSDTETFPQAHPVIFTAFLGVTFTLGIFLAGWLAIQRRWLPLKPRYPAEKVISPHRTTNGKNHKRFVGITRTASTSSGGSVVSVTVYQV